MANDFTALGSAIYARLSGQGTVNVYYALAPQGGTPPYCIYQRQDAVDEYTFTSSEVSTDYIVKVVSNRNWPGEAQSVYGHIHTAMQNASLSISGYQLLRCRRLSTIEYREPDGFWHIGGVYRIDAHQT